VPNTCVNPMTLFLNPTKDLLFRGMEIRCLLRILTQRG